MPLIADGGISAVGRRRGARGVLDDRRRQPVLHQRRADAGQPPGHDHRGPVLQADPHLQRASSSSSDRCSCGPPSCSRAGDGMTTERRTARRHPRRRPDPGAGRAARHDDARRPRRPGDQGRGARHRRRHPRLGPAVRRARSDDAARVDVLPVRQPQQGVGHPRPQGRRPTGTCCCALVAGPTCWWRTSAPACWTGSASASRRSHELQPAAGGAVDHRLRARRPRGRPGRLRPDRPGRGRADVADRLRPRRPAEGRACRSRTCWPACTARTASSPRCCERRPHRAGAPWCAPRCSRRSSACTPSRAPGGRSPGEVGRAQGNHHPSIAPYGLFHCADGTRADRGRQRGAVAPAVRRASTSTRPPPGWRPTPSGSRTATGSSRSSRRRSPSWTADDLLAQLAEVGDPGRARCAASTRSTSGTRPPARACSSTSSTTPSGRSPCPVRRCGSSTGRRRRGHPHRPPARRRPWTRTAPPVRAWLTRSPTR